MSRLTASRVAFDLIASFEGYRARAARAPDGQWTLGFGHTATAREGLTVTRNEAEDLLRWDLLPIEDTLRQVALMPLSQNQFDALVSFAFNIGLENFKNSNVLKSLNQGQPVAAALNMHAWRRAQVNGQVLTIDALVRRRAAEAALFLETAGARPAAPTSVVRPQIGFASLAASNDIGAAPTESHLNLDVFPTLAPVEPSDVPVATAPDPAPPTLPKASMPEQVETPILSAPTPEQLVDQVATVDTPDWLDAFANQGTDLPAASTLPAPEVRPAIEIAPLPANRSADPSKQIDINLSAKPIVPVGLSPFPGTEPPQSANGMATPTNLPANDGALNRLHAAPEALEAPIGSAPVQQALLRPAGPAEQPKIHALDKAHAGVPAIVWMLIGLGLGLFAIGLYISWQSGILSVQTPRADLTNGQLAALFAAASGFIILVTSGVAAFTGAVDDEPVASPKA